MQDTSLSSPRLPCTCPTTPWPATPLDAPPLRAQATCARVSRRLCHGTELRAGVCCGSGCGFDDIRVWSRDPCPLPNELTPIPYLPMRGEILRVSINGQQYSMVRSTSQPPSYPPVDPNLPPSSEKCTGSPHLTHQEWVVWLSNRAGLTLTAAARGWDGMGEERRGSGRIG